MRMHPDEMGGPGVRHQGVAGFCPMGCGAGTLALRPGGEVYCAALSCPDPDAVATILANPETEHVVIFTEESFAVKHPLRERVSDHLFSCRLYEELRALDGPPVEPGTYRVTRHENDPTSESRRSDAIGWDFEELPADTERGECGADPETRPA